MAALAEIDKRYDAVEKAAGFPQKKRFFTVSGTLDFNMLVIEREWESMAAMEEAWTKNLSSPEQQALTAELTSIVKRSRVELYTPM